MRKFFIHLILLASVIRVSGQDTTRVIPIDSILPFVELTDPTVHILMAKYLRESGEKLLKKNITPRLMASLHKKR
ncbi:hypothetical protein OAH12_02535 [Cyclobacteriaceae bacterium]|nr:hypothetical protein [Cyclobacteriaceae bacterium]